LGRGVELHVGGAGGKTKGSREKRIKFITKGTRVGGRYPTWAMCLLGEEESKRVMSKAEGIHLNHKRSKGRKKRQETTFHRVGRRPSHLTRQEPEQPLPRQRKQAAGKRRGHGQEKEKKKKTDRRPLVRGGCFAQDGAKLERKGENEKVYQDHY